MVAVLEAVEIGATGGGPVTLRGTGIAPGTYSVHIGPLGTSEDPVTFPEEVTFEDTDTPGTVEATVYLPPLPYGVSYRMTIGVLVTNYAVTYYPDSFLHRTMSLRRLLPPSWRTGTRSTKNTKFPQ